ncbi:MAG: hypothetical protein H6729_11760 [Deltaproteobacteria bacterium]|nr:hypothetical protein [Deltaproteobacteria bacterium]
MNKWLFLGMTLGLFAFGCGGTEEDLSDESSSEIEFRCQRDEDCGAGFTCQLEKRGTTRGSQGVVYQRTSQYGTCVANYYYGSGSGSGRGGGWGW